jgi:hypothetical protein
VCRLHSVYCICSSECVLLPKMYYENVDLVYSTFHAHDPDPDLDLDSDSDSDCRFRPSFPTRYFSFIFDNTFGAQTT